MHANLETAILALPAARHPRLRSTVTALAGDPDMTLDLAARLLDATCRQLGITGLDIEMVQPGANVAVPFVPASSTNVAESYQEGVAALVHARIMGARK